MSDQIPTSFRVRNWAQFQHFKDRRPPWIKLYRELLENKEWHRLEPISAKLLTGLWLLASEDPSQQGDLPDIDTISFRLRISVPELDQCLKPLIGPFIEALDINPISTRYQDDLPETETETEIKGDITSDIPPRKRSKSALPDPPSWLPLDVWDEWVTHRREIGHTLKSTTIKAQWGKLGRLRDQGHDPAMVIRNSIEGGYHGLFPPKPDRTNGPTDDTPRGWK